MELTIDKATLRDLDELEQLYNETNDFLASNINYPGWIKGTYPVRNHAVKGLESGSLFAARNHNKIVGSVILNQEAELVYKDADWGITVKDEEVFVLHTFVVHPLYLKCGIGKKILDFSCETGRKLQMKAMRLDVYEKNTPAIQLYEKCGYCYIDTVDLGLRNYGLDWFRLYEHIL